MNTEQIVITKYGEADVLKISTTSKNMDVKKDQILIQVHYSGINFADVVMRLGLYRDAPPKPFVPGYEVSGVVTQVGPDVTRFKVGDEVMAGTRFGGYTSHLILSEWQVLKKPAHLDLKASAALPVNYLTAHIALFEIGRARQGDKVLVDCATGGVGVMALQMLQKIGAEVIGLTGTPSKKPFIERYNATAMTWDEIAERPDVKDFDIIMNSSAGKTINDHYARLNKAGHLVCFGASEGIENGKRSIVKILKMLMQTPKFGTLKLVMDNKSIGGLNALYYFDDQKWMEKRLTLLENTDVVPHIGSVFAAKDVAKAHRFIETRQAKGKVLLEWSH